jgi:ABC-type glycerol-3-phosphate transport system permease component
MTRARGWTSRLEATAIWLVLACGAAIMFFPVYWMLATALRPREEIFTPDVGLIPSALVWSNYTDALARLPFLSWAANTGGGSPSRSRRSSTCGDYAREFRFAGRNMFSCRSLVQPVIPIEVIIVPCS